MTGTDVSRGSEVSRQHTHTHTHRLSGGICLFAIVTVTFSPSFAALCEREVASQTHGCSVYWKPFICKHRGWKVSSDKHTRACLSAFRKWNLLTAVLSSFHNECVLVISVLCDSPRVAVWLKFGLWFFTDASLTAAFPNRP